MDCFSTKLVAQSCFFCPVRRYTRRRFPLLFYKMVAGNERYVMMPIRRKQAIYTALPKYFKGANCLNRGTLQSSAIAEYPFLQFSQVIEDI